MSDIRDFTLPDLGEGLEEGEIVEWHVEVGDTIELNQTVADVETAKAVVAVPSPFAGKVVERIGEIGEALQVGAVFVRVDVAVEGGEVADEVDAPDAAADGGSPAQGGFEAGEQAAGASTPASVLDGDEEPQPLVGYGQGRAGSTRRRRRGRGGTSSTATEAASNGAASAADDGVPDAGGSGAPARPLAKPPVRKLAKDRGVDLAAIAPGSGPGGIVTREDVEAAAGHPATTVGASGTPAADTGVAAGPGGDAAGAGPTTSMPELRAVGGEKPVPGFRGRVPGEVEPIRGIRRRIAEHMATSRREIPDASCTRDADLTELWALREVLTAQARDDGFEVRITPFALVLRATVLALRRFPTLNARIEPDEDDPDAPGAIHLLEHVNLGFAADTDRGLVVPNIKDAHERSTLQLALALTDLAAQARDGRIGPRELTGGTFTVNNYGAFGVDDGDPIINHPEAAILGVGTIRPRPWVVADPDDADGPGQLAVRRVARFTLAFDHRVCDGGEAGRFLTYVTDLCEQPGRLLLHV
jgi:2-oxoisovalerate dehydrogenase E2 component (dihydrolipoyl transacylase)